MCLGKNHIPLYCNASFCLFCNNRMRETCVTSNFEGTKVFQDFLNIKFNVSSFTLLYKSHYPVNLCSCQPPWNMSEHVRTCHRKNTDFLFREKPKRKTTLVTLLLSSTEFMFRSVLFFYDWTLKQR